MRTLQANGATKITAFSVAVAAACAGTAVMDQLLFFLGRYGRSTRMVSRMVAKPAFARASGFIEAHPISFVMSFRFIFGLRAAGPVVAGLSAMGFWTYTALNVAAAAAICLFEQVRQTGQTSR